MSISIHALLAESDRFHFEKTAIVEGFLSTLSLRRATPKGRREKQEAKNFYPRSPCGERRPIDSIAIPSIRISIHALLAESDALAPEENATQQNFYPRSPCGERHRGPLRNGHHPPNFYPRSPCGERRITEGSICFDSSISIHALLAESDGRAFLARPFLL